MAEQETGAEPKERILQAAIRLFARYGYGGTGLRTLATEARVNLAMINYYYGSKGKLLEAVLDTAFRHSRVVIKDAIAAAGTPEEVARRAIRGFVQFGREQPDLIRIVLTELPYDLPDIAEYKAERIRRNLQLVVGTVLPAAQRLAPRPLDPAVIGPAIVGVTSFHFLMRPVIERVFGTEFDDAFYEQFADRVADIVLYGLLGQPPHRE